MGARVAIAAVLLTGVVALSGCGASAPVREPEANAPPRVYVEAPFRAQTDHYCGPAALSSVLGWSGIEVAPRVLGDEVYLPTRQGALQAELVAAARRHGRIAYVLEPDLDALLAELEAGNPVLVLQNLAFSWLPQWHYAVVVGREGERMVLHSGGVRDYRVARSTFERTWDRGGRWAMLVLPPERLPATAEVNRYLQAVAALEAIGRLPAAERGYRTAMAAWPDAHAARLGLAATVYGQGRSAEAEQELRALVAVQPFWGPALNNLAHLLVERGALEEAEQWARRAVAAGGPHAAEAEQTLGQILDRRRTVSTLAP